MRLVSIPKIVQNRPFHLKPATDLGPTKIGKYQKLEPFLSHTYVLRNKHIEMAPGSTNDGKGGVKEGGGGSINGRNRRPSKTLRFRIGKILEAT